jgi:hypothetical protein
VGPHVAGEDIEGAAHETDGAVRVSTRAAPVDLNQSALKSCHEV